MRLVLLPTIIISLALPAIAANPRQYVAGTCKQLNSRGWGNFPAGDPNYTAACDRDRDGIACEF